MHARSQKWVYLIHLVVLICLSTMTFINKLIEAMFLYARQTESMNYIEEKKNKISDHKNMIKSMQLI